MLKTCSKCTKDYEDDFKKSSMCPSCRSLMGRRSKRKGASNERRFFQKLQALFDKYELKYRVRRTPRSGAIHEFEPSDGMFSGLPYDSIFKAHFELKDSATWSIEDWYTKALEIEKDRGTLRPPILVIRKPSSQLEFAVVDADYLINLMVKLEILNHEKNK